MVFLLVIAGEAKALLITLAMALLGSGVPVNHNSAQSLLVKQHDQTQDTETKQLKYGLESKMPLLCLKF